jgi:cytochrome c oxidase subunit II
MSSTYPVPVRINGVSGSVHVQTWPATATTQAAVLASDWTLFTIVGLLVAALVWGLILFALIRWRRREGDALPPQFRQNNPLEVTWTAIPLVLVIALFIYTYRAEATVESIAPRPGVTIGVSGFRWGWTFAYTGGPTVTGTAVDPPELVLPLDETARIQLTSADVTHSFWVPDFVFKRDAIPGLTTTFDLRPDKLGTFVGRCAQFCGLDHALMSFSVRVVSPQDYARWLAAAKESAR